ncbi:MAG: cysteine desulfurase, partial [Candidatus Nephrothrix sp. EaCA]
RKARAAVEMARKKTAELMSCAPGEIIFTSGGTEADNAILCGAIEKYAISHLITSPAEHHAVLHTLRRYSKKLTLDFVKLDEKGNADMDDLEKQLKKSPALVSLMYGNNEIGNL